MKLSMVYNANDHKLFDTSYSQTYRHMFDALIAKFPTVQHVTKNCSSQDIDGDVVIFYDVHSSHDITIDGMQQHKSIKYSYLNDPHQPDQLIKYRDGTTCVKLGPHNRVRREFKRGTNFIICPYSDAYYRFLAPHMGDLADKMLVWFPVSPKAPTDFTHINKMLNARIPEVVLNGHVWPGVPGFRPYEFRGWVAKQPEIVNVPHVLDDPTIPKGNDYTNFLSKYAGALALTEWHVVPKYLEIPMAGCVCFAQSHSDYYHMGFRDGLNYIDINYFNFKDQVLHFKNHITDYQQIATNGQQLVKNNYTAEHFANFIYNHAQERL